PDNLTLATSGNDHIVRLTNMQTGETREIPGERGLVPAKVRFSPNGRMIGVSSAGSLLVLNAEDGSPLDRFTVPQQGGFAALVASPVEFTFSVDSLTLILGPIPDPPDPNSMVAVSRYVEWRPEF